MPSGRLDIAALALVVVFSAFVNAASMVGPRARVPGAGVLLMVAAIAASLLLVRDKLARELLCRCSLALVPLGLAMWTAHLLFHFSTAWYTAWPVLQRVTGWFGRPDWRAAQPLLAADTLLGVQILLLDAGILSLYPLAGCPRPFDVAAVDGRGNRGGTVVAGVWIFLSHANARHGTRMKQMVILAMLVCQSAHADGGVVCLHEASGPFLVTVVMAPAPLTAGPVDATVVVQDSVTGAALPDAGVELTFRDASGTVRQAERARANTYRIDLPTAGRWAVSLQVTRDKAAAAFVTAIQVDERRSRLLTVWPLLILPWVMIALWLIASRPGAPLRRVEPLRARVPVPYTPGPAGNGPGGL